MSKQSTIDLLLVAVTVANASIKMPNVPFNASTAKCILKELLEAAQDGGFKQLDITKTALRGGNADTTINLLTTASEFITEAAATAALKRAGLIARPMQ